MHFIRNAQILTARSYRPCCLFWLKITFQTATVLWSYQVRTLGIVTSIIECASYLRGRHFIVECDHKALKPFFQKSLKGAIYERWLAILQQFNFDIKYKKCDDMVVPDAPSRCNNQNDPSFSSPEENNPFSPYVPEQTEKNNITQW